MGQEAIDLKDYFENSTEEERQAICDALGFKKPNVKQLNLFKLPSKISNEFRPTMYKDVFICRGMFNGIDMPVLKVRDENLLETTCQIIKSFKNIT